MPTFTLHGEPLAYGDFSTGEGEDLVNHSVQVLELWTDEELAAIGVVRTPDPAPVIGPPPRPLLRKSLIQERVHALGRLEDMFDLLLAPGNRIYYARWFAPDWKEVYADDPDLIAMLIGVGCTPDEVASVTAPA